MNCYRVYLGILLVIAFPMQAATHHPEEFLKSIAHTPHEGEQVYNHFCVNCHAQKPIIPLGAPRIGEAQDWLPRIKNGLDVLFKHTDEGLNGMPPRGGCFECSDRQLLLAIITMVPKMNKKDLLNELRAYKKYKE